MNENAKNMAPAADEDYSAKITYSTRALTVREKIKFKRAIDVVKLDEETKAEPVQIDVDVALSVKVHNEKSESKDYERYIVVDKDGTIYTTGSESFWRSFLDIFEELTDAGEEECIIKVVRIPSKNYVGRDFLNCQLV